ncbi:MAG: cupin domain-containing protein [Solirubrobacterales bacterium]|nr:cupin domain-containing protein [Solirubrobacterales bacterium]
MRRVVTGQRDDGKSVFVEDRDLEPVLPPVLGGNRIYEMWGADEQPKLPTDGSRPAADGYFAPAGGYRFGFFTIPPTSHEPEPIADMDAALAETERLTPGMTKAVTDNEGMHFTDTVDFLIVMEGEVHLELDGGESKLLKAGDCVVQNGTNHAWYNRHPDATAVIFVAFVGGTREG